jgi:LemA protein
MKLGLIIVVVLVLIGLLFGGKVVGTRNTLVQEREQIRATWAQVDNDIQRRADLIPNLVNTVKGYAAHEKGVLDDIAAARAGLLNAKTPQERIDQNNRLEGALGRLLVVVENYPQLKANENFIRLQDELSGTENRIAQDRRRYNEAVKQYNIDIELFPNNIAAGLFGFRHEDAYFKTEPAAREVPKVQF